MPDDKFVNKINELRVKSDWLPVENADPFFKLADEFLISL